MSNKIVLSLAGIVGALFAANMFMRGTVVPPQSVIEPKLGHTQIPPAGTITLDGEATCLPHRGNPEVTTTECAYGFKDTKGNYYGIRDTSADLHIISQLQLQSSLRITGTFKPQRDETYESVGTIDIETIETGVTENATTLTGTFLCLPHKDTTGPQTQECAFGFKTDEGMYYAANFGQSAQAMQQFQNGEPVTVRGFITPLAELSTNTWDAYPIEGIFTVVR